MKTTKEMTLERASELVDSLRRSCPPPSTNAEDLFGHFVQSLQIETQEELEMFAEMCGYGVIREVKLL